MPRLARVVFENVPYHVTQRGNRRQKVFFATDDYHQDLDWLHHY
jgi:putative transposase